MSKEQMITFINRRNGIFPISEYADKDGIVDLYCVVDPGERPLRFPDCMKRNNGDEWGWISYKENGCPFWRYVDGRNSAGEFDGIYPRWKPVAFSRIQKFAVEDDYEYREDVLERT